MTAYLTKEDVLAIAEAGLPSVKPRDAGQLHAAVLRPQTTAFGEDAYPNLWEKAAALLQSILIGHPLADGNKRLAWLSVDAFLYLNGEDLGLPDENTAYDLIIAVTIGELVDIPDIAARLRKLPQRS